MATTGPPNANAGVFRVAKHSLSLYSRFGGAGLTVFRIDLGARFAIRSCASFPQLV